MSKVWEMIVCVISMDWFFCCLACFVKSLRASARLDLLFYFLVWSLDKRRVSGAGDSAYI